MQRIGLCIDAAAQETYAKRLQNAVKRREAVSAGMPGQRGQYDGCKGVRKPDLPARTQHDDKKKMKNDESELDGICDQEGPWQRAAGKKSEKKSKKNSGGVGKKPNRIHKKDKSDDDAKD